MAMHAYSTTASRRALIGVLALPFLPAAAALANTASPEGTSAPDAAFVEWLDASRHYNRHDVERTAAEDAAAQERLDLSEARLEKQEPSVAAAVALLLREVAYEIPPPSHPQTFNDALNEHHQEDRLPFVLLSYLGGALSGSIGRYASDILNNPNRALTESALYRCYHWPPAD